MKKMKAALVDLHYDILKEILIRVARSSDGAKHFANAISVSKALNQFVEDVDVLSAVNFDNILVYGRWEWFQLRGGLTCRCARSGQTQAQFILAKIILVSASQLLIAKTEPIDMDQNSCSKDGNLSEKAAQASDFLGNFLPNKTNHNFVGHHFDFVKIFLSRATSCEFTEMKPYINNYMNYFIVCMELDHKHHSTMKHLVDSQLSELEHCYCNEKLFALIKLPSTRIFCLFVAMDCRLLGLKKEVLGTIIALITEESEEVGYDYFTMVVAILDLKLKRIRALKAVLESVRTQHRVLVSEESEEVSYGYIIRAVAELDISPNKAISVKAFLESLRLLHRPSLPVQDELTYDALFNKSMCQLEILTRAVTVFEMTKAIAFRMQEKRASIISTFHQLLRKRARQCNCSCVLF